MKHKRKPRLTEVWRMRVTPEQKQVLMDAAPYSGGSALVWRDYNVYTAEQLLKLKAGEITVSQFSDTVSEYAGKHLVRVVNVSSGESQDEDT
jgi:hypothetical protein